MQTITKFQECIKFSKFRNSSSWFLNIDCVKNPVYLETNEGAVKSAIWFWKINNLSGNMSNEDITKVINGSLNGLQDRINQLYVIRKFLRNQN